jgi:hypothetical protein
MKKLLTTFIEAVVFLFAAFGGFLTNIAPPPQTNASFAVGIGSFFVLIVLMIISAISREASALRYRRRWIKAGVICFLIALPLGLLYPWVLGKLTYPYPPLPEHPIAQHVNGWELTETARNFIKGNPGNYSPGQLELELPYEEIWTASSLSAAKMLLLLHYTALILALSTAIFCLLEANISGILVKVPVTRKKGNHK